VCGGNQGENSIMVWWYRVLEIIFQIFSITCLQNSVSIWNILPFFLNKLFQPVTSPYSACSSYSSTTYMQERQLNIVKVIWDSYFFWLRSLRTPILEILVRTLIISTVLILFCFVVESHTKKGRHFYILHGCDNIKLEMFGPKKIILV
jgi:hypothetical protein